MNPTINDNETNRLFREMREKHKTKTPQTATNFAVLPDGEYIGRVYILVNTVANEKSPNYGRTKYEIQLTVTEGTEKGKMAYNHRVVLPYNLALKPADEAEAAEWTKQVTLWLHKTDEILSKCGVDVTETEDLELVPARIAANNRRRPTVAFTMKNSVPYINYPVRKDTAGISGLPYDDDGSIPDGNDAPL